MISVMDANFKNEYTKEFNLPLEQANLIIDRKLKVYLSRTKGPIQGFWENSKFTVTDGNHRVIEAIERGDKLIKAIIDSDIIKPLKWRTEHGKIKRSYNVSQWL